MSAQIGFAKVDITPRVGVPLCGFGPFLNRCSIGIRDRLWARAMAVEQAGQRVVVISCDLVAISAADTQEVRRRVEEATHLDGSTLMISCSHTHSGPDTWRGLIGWGGMDEPYMQLLPRRIARAAIEAVGNMRDATLSHAEVPCEGIGLNREYDRDAPPLAEVLAESWRPAKPELTDTTCHVVAARSAMNSRSNHSGDTLLGFFSYFGCHPVCCCQETRYIHGDFVGVATNTIEREFPGSVGLFLQGAEGDVNSCVVHKGEAESMLALDVIAARYAAAVRNGLGAAPSVKDVAIDTVASAQRMVRFSRRPWTQDDLRQRLAKEQAILDAASATDSDDEYRLAVVRAIGLRRALDDMAAGKQMDAPIELQGIRIGPICLLASPFETFQAIKNDVRAAARSPLPMVLGVTNDIQGYAPDRTTAQRGGYAADQVPLMQGRLPFANLHDELVKELLSLDAELNG